MAQVTPNEELVIKGYTLQLTKDEAGALRRLINLFDMGELLTAKEAEVATAIFNALIQADVPYGID